jgi:hypothetical protein
MERSEGDMSLKNPVTPPGIDPGTVRLVAQRLNHYATPGSKEELSSVFIFSCFRKLAKRDYPLRLFCLSARINNLAPTEMVFLKFYIRIFFENLSPKIQVSLKSDKNNGNFK